MAEKQYDLSPKLLRLFEEKQKIRQAIRDAVLKNETNPHIHYSPLYDRAITKYHALWYYRNEHVKPNVRNMSVLFGLTLLPIVAIFFSLVHHNNKKEEIFRSGKVAYKDRCYKNVL